ncbi:MAG: VOC family protein [Dehalococcoidia bacterium]
MPDISPFIRYRDAKAAIAWLQEAFGFEPEFVQEGSGGSIGHAQLRAGDGIIMLSTLRENDLSMTVPGPDGRSTAGIYVTVPDADAHHDRAKAAGAKIVMPPTDEDYGGRDYVCHDPEGHVWSFGTYRPGSEGTPT